MNYRTLNLQQLAKLLNDRKLGNALTRSELGRLYGVPGLPPQQEAARQEAIAILESADRNSPIRKVGKMTGWIVALLVGISGIIEFFINIFSGH